MDTDEILRTHVAKSVRPREDALDIEAFETMLRSMPFAAFLARVGAELERARDTCERSADAVELSRAQGKTSALRVVIGLGPAMLREMQGKPWRPSS